MAIITVMKMELRFIMSQGFTSLLILLYPFLLMLVVGPIFSSTRPEGVMVAIFSSTGQGFLGHGDGINGDSQMKGFDKMTFFYTLTKEEMMEEVLSGDAVLGISIEDDEHGRRKFYVYYEPSKQVIANGLALQLQGLVADSSAELVETNLVKVWNNMKALSSDIDVKLEKIPALRSSFKESRDRIGQLQQSIHSSDAVATGNSLSQMQGDIASMQQEISQMGAKLNSWENSINQLATYDSKLAYYDSKLASTDSQLLALQNNLYAWDSKLLARISQLDSVASSISTYLAVVRNLKSTESGSTLESLIQIENGLQDSLNQVNSARSELAQMRSDLQNMLAQVSSARNDISQARGDIASTRSQISSTSSSARADLNNLRQQLSDASSKLSSASVNLGNAQGSLNSFSSLANSMENYLSESTSEIDKLNGELDGTEMLLRNAKQNVAQFLANNPLDYVPPKFEKLSEKRELRYLDSLFPIIIGLVSMLSCLLLPPIMAVKQKTQGLRTRMRLSYASPLSIIIGKFLGDFIVGFVQVIVVTVAGSMLFGVNLGTNTGDLAFALVLAPAVFTALGTLLAAFVANEGSAVLSSLLVSMPMIFMSGIVLPIELIHPSLRVVATAVPLYNVVEMLGKVTIRNAPFYATSNIIACIGYLFLFLALSYIFWRNKD
ncbi:MAG TPA: ABC transporter permease [Candidatus Norongarragalinales archaeon]|nr:ABC transporter permease [Candidatus Norongarragalinales archaeon]